MNPSPSSKPVLALKNSKDDEDDNPDITDDGSGEPCEDKANEYETGAPGDSMENPFICETETAPGSTFFIMGWSMVTSTLDTPDMPENVMAFSSG